MRKDVGHTCVGICKTLITTLIDLTTLNGFIGLQLIGTDPQTLHQQRELLGEGGLLELETVV